MKTLQAKVDGRDYEDNLQIIDAILEERGITDIDSFLHPTEDDMIPFEEMLGLQEAYQTIDDAITMGEKILVHADIDADGISAGTILMKYL